MKIPFKVSARTARLIGRENVSNAESAIIELVKNTYDADSSYCCVAIDSKNDCMYIIDNGEGMSEAAIVNHWMLIGTQNKLDDFESQRGRIKSGAKGIGRFALDRLGENCTLYSSPRDGGKKLKWVVNWSVFDEQGSDTIDKITAELSYEEFSHQDLVREILGDGISTPHNLDGGVIIKISGLRDSWGKEELKDLYSNLETTIPPKEEAFNLYLYSLEDRGFGEVLPALCDDFDFKLDATVENGEIKVTIHRHEYSVDGIPDDFFKGEVFPYDKQTFENGFYDKRLSLNSLIPGFVDEKGYFEGMGGFTLSLYFMKLATSKADSEKYHYNDFDNKRRKEWLESFGGIKIFRDNFRVRPYGEPDGGAWDWLQLSSRHASSPAAVKRYKAYRVRPQNIAGSIHISRLTNLKFEDKSSREGMQESPEFRLFRNIVIECIRILEDDRSYIASKLDKIYVEKNNIERIRKQAEQRSRELAKKIGKKKENEYTWEEKLAVSVEAQKEEIQSLKEEQRLLRAFASIGLTTTSFAHELSSLDRRLVNRFDQIENLLRPYVSRNECDSLTVYLNPFVLMDENKEEDKKVKQWLEYTLESVRKDKRKRSNINLQDYFSKYKNSWNFTLQQRLVEMSVAFQDKEHGRSFIRAFEIDLDTIFNNLLMNSIDAFMRNVDPRKSGDRTIHISLSSHAKSLVVSYKDNGPGLSQDISNPDDIFAPLFTTKKDKYGADKGTGLGMWLVKNIADDYGAKVELRNSSCGFAVDVIFPLRKEYWGG